jgi:predicted DNA-binding transcriptional regulator AlpA
MESEPLWNIADTAQYLRIPVSSLYKMTAPKAVLRIPRLRIQGRLRFRKEDIDAWLELLSVSDNDSIARIGAAAKRVRCGFNS